METKKMTQGKTETACNGVTEQQKIKTIGQVADELAEEYISLYETFRKDKDQEIKAKAKNLALADLYAKKLIAEFALDKVKRYIAEDEGVQSEVNKFVEAEARRTA